MLRKTLSSHIKQAKRNKMLSEIKTSIINVPFEPNTVPLLYLSVTISITVNVVNSTLIHNYLHECSIKE